MRLLQWYCSPIVLCFSERAPMADHHTARNFDRTSPQKKVGGHVSAQLNDANHFGSTKIHTHISFAQFTPLAYLLVR